MITLPKTLTVEACEEVISSLQGDTASPLELSVDSRSFAFSGLATAVQCAITWGRRSEDRKLFLKPTVKGLEGEFSDILDRPHKFVASMFARYIFNQDDDVRASFNRLASSKIDAQQRNQYGNNKGQLCWFTFVDHSSKGFDRNFYLESKDALPAPRQVEQIKAIINSMIDKSMPGGAKAPNEDARDQIGRIFYELFLNSHEHGSRDRIRVQWIKPGIRVIYTNGITLTSDGIEGTLKEDPILSKYVEKGEGRSRYMEISIIDSGLGYFSRWLEDNKQCDYEKNLRSEYQVFQKCFSFRQSSSGMEHKGNGLPVVMDRLTKLKGFMRIRSGKLALYRNFILAPYEEKDKCEFYDWKTEQPASKELSENASVEGVAITLLIPLEAK